MRYVVMAMMLAFVCLDLSLAHTQRTPISVNR